MRNFFHALLMLTAFAVNAQEPILDYQFNGNTKDESGNNYDGTLVGNAYIWFADCCACIDGCMTIPKGTGSYMIVPAEAFDGLNDFTITARFNVVTIWVNSDPTPELRYTLFSASREGCINCFGVAYAPYWLVWEIYLNGNIYLIPDSTFQSAKPIRIVRENGLVSVYRSKFSDNFKGSFFDDSEIDVTSAQIGQRDFCVGGCFEPGNSLMGKMDEFTVWDVPIYPMREEDEYLSEENIEINIHPNPASSSIQLYMPEASELVVADTYGRTIKKLTSGMSSGAITLSTADLVDGVYFLTLSHEQKKISKKLIVSK